MQPAQTIELRALNARHALKLGNHLSAAGAKVSYHALGHWQVTCRAQDLVEGQGRHIERFTSLGAWLSTGSGYTLCQMTGCSQINVKACWPDTPASTRKP